MKKSMKIAVWAGAMLGVSAQANAQSSVTLYGIADVGVAYVSNENGGHTVSQIGGLMQPDRWGVRGSEDLGAGLSTIFTLENGFSLNNGALGQGGLLFGRQAFVGLSSSAGQVTLGRQYDFMGDLAPYTTAALTTGLFGWHLGDYDRLGGERINNAVVVRSASFNGFQAGALYSFGGVPGDFSSGSAESFGLSYRHGPFSMAAAYTNVHNSTITPATSIGVSSLFGKTVGGPVALDKIVNVGVGGSYVLGPVTLHAVYTLTDMQLDGHSAALDTYESGLSYQITPALSAGAGFAYSKLDDIHWNQYMTGVDYLLSTRTDVYVEAAAIRATGQDVLATLFVTTPSSNREQLEAGLGIRHRF